MSETTPSPEENGLKKLTRPLTIPDNLNKVLIGALVVSVVLGTTTGYVLAKKSAAGENGGLVENVTKSPPKNAEQDKKTFRDFAEGTIKKKPETKNGQEYSEGTHLLEREGAVPVTLTSSVVDLSQFEGKKVKVFGETQKAIKAGWLMDVGRVEELQ